MVSGYHVILSAYGFWLPNDPRGSWSDFVGAWELFRFGPATKTDSTQSVAHEPHNRELRLAFGRAPTAVEARAAENLVEAHGLAILCRALFNANEFVFAH